VISELMDGEECNSLQGPFSDGGEHFGQEGEALVETGMFIRSIGPLDICNMDYESWRDPGLACESGGWRDRQK